jgi:hypothetical protein
VCEHQRRFGIFEFVRIESEQHINILEQRVGWTHYNLISLDTETSEPNILVSFPWTEITVDYFLIEQGNIAHIGVNNDEKLKFIRMFMPLVGYDRVDYISSIDDLFARRGIK